LKAFDVLYKMRYILWVGALLGACDIIQDSGHIGRHLGFCQKLKIIKQRRKLEIVNVSHVKYDIIKHSFTQKWLHRLLLMTSLS